MGGQPFVNQVGWLNPITGDEGNLTIDKIQSPGFISGVQGWRISKNGDAEFNDAFIRGTLQSSNFVAGVSGWQLSQSGNAEMNDLHARGEFDIVNGNAQIIIKNDSAFLPGFPGIFLYPDVTTFDFGLLVAGILSADTAYTQLASPQDLTDAGAHTADLFLNSGTTAKRSLATINSDLFQVFGGFGFEGLATQAVATADSAAVTPGNNLDIVTVTIGAEANCTYEIRVTHRGVGFVTPVAFPGNRCQIRVTRNGTQIASNQILAGNTTLTQEGGGYTICDTPGAGTITYAFNLLHDAASTAASVHTVAVANAPCAISVRGFKANL